jgi:hypothetical protein
MVFDHQKINYNNLIIKVIKSVVSMLSCGSINVDLQRIHYLLFCFQKSFCYPATLAEAHCIMFIAVKL